MECVRIFEVRGVRKDEKEKWKGRSKEKNGEGIGKGGGDEKEIIKSEIGKKKIVEEIKNEGNEGGRKKNGEI